VGDEMNPFRFTLLFILAFLAIFALTSLVASGDAVADTHWWDGEGGDALASTAANWNSTGGNDIAPTTGDDAVFNTTSTKSCTWDITDEIASFTMDTGYSGTITQNCEVTISGNCTISDGTLTGDTTNWWIVGGNYSSDSGHVSLFTLKMKMTGDGTTISFGDYFYSVWFDANITSTSTIKIRYYSSSIFKVSDGKTLTCGDNAIYVYAYSPFASFKNYGNITGTGTLKFVHKLNLTASMGNIENPVLIMLLDSLSSTSSMILENDTVLGSTLTVQSEHDTYTMTLDTNGHNLSCTDLTLKDRGIFLGGSGTHTISGSLDAVATDSDFDPETSTVILGGTNQNIQLNADDSFYDLAIQSNDTNCLTSINVTHDLYFIDREPLMSYTVDNATDTLGEYDANDAGEIHLGIIILGIGNDYSTSLIPFILEILSTPEIIAYISIDYLYEVLTNAPAAAVINATSNASFILVYDSGVWGTPEVYQMGSYWVNVSAEYAGQEVYQNYTLTIANSSDDETDPGPIYGNRITVRWSTESSGHLKMTFQYWIEEDDVEVIRVQWNFGDGHGSSLETLSHRYSSPGEYRVTCAVWGDNGGLDTEIKWISVGSENTDGPNSSSEWDLVQWIEENVLLFLIVVGLGAIIARTVIDKNRGGRRK
jgi:hypothetical protein